ncbi:hypothetical protein [Micromonospora sp. NPDC050495]|uniref:hypothetical protein n=1 Tax=Micromonospora sp. NPDC050495 TaxID=3154936 RepID=UPI0034113A33
MAARGKADVTRLARDATEITWRRSPRPQLLVTATQHTELVALAARAATVLGEDTSQKLCSRSTSRAEQTVRGMR